MKVISALIHDEAFRAVFLIVIGFLLAQLNSYFLQRGERKKAVSLALSELLEVRNQFVGLELTMEQVVNLAGSIPEHVKAQFRVTLDSFFPKWEEQHSRYDQSVTTLAALDPLLAYELRSKDFIRPILMTLHSIMSQDPQAAALIGPTLKEKLLGKIEPTLNKSILKLAWGKSLLCWYRTNRLLRKSGVPDDAREFVTAIKDILEAQQKAAAAQVEAQKAGQPI